MRIHGVYNTNQVDTKGDCAKANTTENRLNYQNQIDVPVARPAYCYTGVQGDGRGLAVLDVDVIKEVERVDGDVKVYQYHELPMVLLDHPMLTKTMRVRSGKGGLHFYFFYRTKEGSFKTLKIPEGASSHPLIKGIEFWGEGGNSGIFPPGSKFHDHDYRPYTVENPGVDPLDVTIDQLKGLWDWITTCIVPLPPAKEVSKRSKNYESPEYQAYKQKLNDSIDIPTLLLNTCGEPKRVGTRDYYPCKHGNSSNPSMPYYEETKTWHCFKCDVGGDGIALVAHLDGTNYKTAMMKVARQAGMAEALPPQPDNTPVVEDNFPPTIAGDLARMGYARMSTRKGGWWIKNVDGRGCIYQNITEDDMTAAARELLKPVCPKGVKDSDINETIHELRDINHYNAETEFMPDKRVMHWSNGVFLVDTWEFVAYSDPDFYSKTGQYYLPSFCHTDVKYTPKVEVPRDFLVALDKYFDGNAADIKKLQQFVGYMLYRGNEYKTALLCIAPHDAGKSTLARIVQRLLGKEPNKPHPNVTGTTLKMFCDNQFAPAAAMNALVVYDDDIGAANIDDYSIFKQALGHGTLHYEKKGLDGFDGPFYGKFWLNANTLPFVKNIAEDFTSKILVLVYKARFTADPKEVNPKKKIYLIDRTFEARMMEPAALEGIAQWALAGLQDLINQGGFHGINPKTTLDLWERETDIVKGFIEDRCVLDITNEEWYVMKDEFVTQLGRYAIEKQQRDGKKRYVPDKRRVSDHAHLYGFTSGRKYIKPDDADRGKQEDVYFGIQFNDAVKESPPKFASFDVNVMQGGAAHQIMVPSEGKLGDRACAILDQVDGAMDKSDQALTDVLGRYFVAASERKHLQNCVNLWRNTKRKASA